MIRGTPKRKSYAPKAYFLKYPTHSLDFIGVDKKIAAFKGESLDYIK